MSEEPNSPTGDEGSSSRSSAEIQADIERAREELSRDLDALTNKLSPKAQLDAAKEQASKQVNNLKNTAQAFSSDVAAGDTQALKKAAVIGGAVIGFAALIIGRRRRSG